MIGPRAATAPWATRRVSVCAEPKVVEKFGKTSVDRSKTDRADARLTADGLGFGRMTPWAPPDPRYAALPVLTCPRRQASRLITQENEVLVEQVCVWAPYVHTNEPFFSNVFGTPFQAVLARYTHDPLANLAAVGRERLKAPETLAQTL